MFFKAKKNAVTNESKQNSDKDEDTQMEKIEELLMKATVGKEDYQKKEEKSVSLLNSISKQIELTKDEYNKAVAELMPVKWELAEKKSEIDRIKFEYEVVSSHLKRTKAELAEIGSQQNKKEAVSEDIKDMNSVTSLLKSEQEKFVAEIANLNSEKEVAKSVLEEYEEKIREAKLKFTNVTAQLGYHQNELTTLIGQEKAKRKEISLLKRELKFIETELYKLGKNGCPK